MRHGNQPIFQGTCWAALANNVMLCQTMMKKYYAMGFGLSVSRFLHSLSAVTCLQRPIMCWKLSNEQLHSQMCSIPKVSWHDNSKPTLCHVWTKILQCKHRRRIRFLTATMPCSWTALFPLVLVMNIRLLKEQYRKRGSGYRKENTTSRGK